MGKEKRVTVPLSYLSRTGTETSFGYLSDDSIPLVLLHALANTNEIEMTEPLDQVPPSAGGREVIINIDQIENVSIKEIFEAFEMHVEQMKALNKKPVLPNPYTQLRKLIYYKWCDWPLFQSSKYDLKNPVLFDKETRREINQNYNAIRSAMRRSRHTTKGANAQSKWLEYCETMIANGAEETSEEFRKAAVEYWNNECKNKASDPKEFLLETYYGSYNNTKLRQKARWIVTYHPEYNEFGDYQTVEGRINIVKEFDRAKAEKEHDKLIKIIDKGKIV